MYVIFNYESFNFRLLVDSRPPTAPLTDRQPTDVRSCGLQKGSNLLTGSHSYAYVLKVNFRYILHLLVFDQHITTDILWMSTSRHGSSMNSVCGHGSNNATLPCRGGCMLLGTCIVRRNCQPSDF